MSPRAATSAMKAAAESECSGRPEQVSVEGSVKYSRERWSRAIALAFAVLCYLSLGAPAWAQQASGIAGVVRDTSGLAMPGVTVEAASPALIEKVRSVVTDGEGRYTIVDLRPGTYTVTFSLTGFSTVKRDGITLGAGFTASVNVSMQVGSLEETITVSGAAPVVDTHEHAQAGDAEHQRARGAAERQRRSPDAGLRHARLCGDAGGRRRHARHLVGAGQLHASTTARPAPAPRSTASATSTSSARRPASATSPTAATSRNCSSRRAAWAPNPGSGSTSLNAIPKSGSNTFAGGLDGYFSNGGMQAANINDNLNDWALGNPDAAQHSGDHVGRQSSTRSTASAGSSAVRSSRTRSGSSRPSARWGSTVQQPSAFYNPLQGKANVPGKGVVGPTPTLFYPGQPGTPVRQHLLRRPVLRRDQAGVQLRLVSQSLGPHHRAGDVEGSRQLLRRPPEVLPLHHRPVHRRELDRVRARLGLVSVRRRAGHVDACR